MNQTVLYQTDIARPASLSQALGNRYRSNRVDVRCLVPKDPFSRIIFQGSLFPGTSTVSQTSFHTARGAAVDLVDHSTSKFKLPLGSQSLNVQSLCVPSPERPRPLKAPNKSLANARMLRDSFFPRMVDLLHESARRTGQSHRRTSALPAPYEAYAARTWLSLTLGQDPRSASNRRLLGSTHRRNV